MIDNSQARAAVGDHYDDSNPHYIPVRGGTNAISESDHPSVSPAALKSEILG